MFRTEFTGLCKKYRVNWEYLLTNRKINIFEHRGKILQDLWISQSLTLNLFKFSCCGVTFTCLQVATVSAKYLIIVRSLEDFFEKNRTTTKLTPFISAIVIDVI